MSSRKLRPRHLVVATAALAAVACASAPQTSEPALTSAPLDVDTGPCMCRLPQDEFLTCCRHGLELTCRCAGTGSTAYCQMVPNGRRCGGATTQP